MSELAVITGTTHGIGRVTSRELARAGKTVVMLCRDVTAASAVRAEILRQVPRARVEVVALRSRLARLGARGRRQRAPRPPAARAPGQQRRHGEHSPPHLGRWLRAHVRDQPSGPLPAHRLAVGTPGPGGARRHGRFPDPLPGPHGSRRGHERARALPGNGRLCPLEARQRAAHVRARAPPGRHRHQRQLPASGGRRHESVAALAACHQAADSPGPCSMPSAARAPLSTSRSIRASPASPAAISTSARFLVPPRAARERCRSCRSRYGTERRVDPSATVIRRNAPCHPEP